MYKYGKDLPNIGTRIKLIYDGTIYHSIGSKTLLKALGLTLEEALDRYRNLGKGINNLVVKGNLHDYLYKSLKVVGYDGTIMFLENTEEHILIAANSFSFYHEKVFLLLDKDDFYLKKCERLTINYLKKQKEINKNED